MKLAVLLSALIIIISSCKSSKPACDAYSQVDEYDIHEISAKSIQKYESVVVLK